jgi:D-alanine-D-alanine ligase
MNIAILHAPVPEGASPDEQDTLVEAQAVAAALAGLGHSAHAVPFTLDLQAAAASLLKRDTDLVFNLVEGVDGQGQLIHLCPSLLDCLRIPYTGAPADAMYLSSNKLLAKRLLRDSGIPTPDWIAGEQDSCNGSAYIIKAVWEHASIGLDEDSIIMPEGRDHLGREITQRRKKWNREFFAERYIDGREFNMSIIAGDSGPRVLPPAEIRFVEYPEGKHRVVGYRAKWDEASFEYQHTQRCFSFPEEDRQLLERIIALSEKCWHAFGLRGYARVDFRVDREGNPFVLEVNANPCIAPDSGFVAAADMAGIDFTGAVERILKDALRS